MIEKLGEFRSRAEKYRFQSWFAPLCLQRYDGREAMEKIYDYAEALVNPEKYDEDHVETALTLLERFRNSRK